MKRNSWFTLIIATIIVSLIFLLVRSFHFDYSKITLGSFKETIHGFGVWGPVIYIVIYIIRPIILFPAAILSAAAGVIWGVEGLIYLLIAANLSAVGEFLAARHFAREPVERFLKGKLRNFDEALEKRGFITVLLIRLIPNIPWDFQNLGLGLTKVKFRDYFWATFLGIMPGSFALVYFGSSLISALTNPKNLWKFAVAIVVLIGVFILQKTLSRERKE